MGQVVDVNVYCNVGLYLAALVIHKLYLGILSKKLYLGGITPYNIMTSTTYY